MGAKARQEEAPRAPDPVDDVPPVRTTTAARAQQHIQASHPVSPRSQTHQQSPPVQQVQQQVSQMSLRGILLSRSMF